MKKSFDSLLRQAPVHNRVVIICVCFTLLSMLVIGGYLVMVMYSKAYENTYEKMQIYTDKTVQNIDQSFHSEYWIGGSYWRNRWPLD